MEYNVTEIRENLALAGAQINGEIYHVNDSDLL